ncbi:alpha/beta hydrolase [Bradyrhizobium elkanii]
MLDPELVLAASVQPKYDFSDPLKVRLQIARLSAALKAQGYWRAEEQGINCEDVSVAHPDGMAFGVRIYTPTGVGSAAPAIVFFHGGGFMVGDLDFEHWRCLKWAAGTSSVVLSCDYRLSPEHRYPAAVEDSCYACLLWAADRATDIGIDAGRIAVAGSSCGGGLAAATALRARDEGGPPILCQTLIYPVLDDQMQTTSMLAFIDTPGWDSRSSVHMWNHYLPEARVAGVPPYAAPARASDLSGLPRTYLMTAEMDPLRDEGLAYGMRLLQAGVPTEIHNFAGAFHAFDAIASSSLARRALDEQVSFFQRAFHRGPGNSQHRE